MTPSINRGATAISTCSRRHSKKARKGKVAETFIRRSEWLVYEGILLWTPANYLAEALLMSESLL